MGLMSPESGMAAYKIVNRLSFFGSTTVDVKNKISSYKSLSNEDFVVCLMGGGSGDYGELKIIRAGYNPISVSYDSNTGILKLTGYGPSVFYNGVPYYDGTAIVDVYVIKNLKDVSS